MQNVIYDASLRNRAHGVTGMRIMAAIKKKKTKKLEFQGPWFESQLERVGMTRKELARQWRRHPSAITFMLQGKRKLKLQEAAQLSELFNVDLNELLFRAGVLPEPSRVSNGARNRRAPNALGTPPRPQKGFGVVTVSGWVDGLMAVHRGRLPQGVVGGEVSDLGVKGVRALRLQTAGSRFEGLDGGIVYYLSEKDAGEGIDAESVGRLCVVKLRSGEELLRVVKRGYELRTFNLYLLDGTLSEESARVANTRVVFQMTLCGGAESLI